MLLPLQGDDGILYIIPKAPLRYALGYAVVAPAGRAHSWFTLHYGFECPYLKAQ